MQVRSGQWWGSHWDAPAFASNLQDASLGFPRNLKVRESGTLVLDKLQTGSCRHGSIQKDIFQILSNGIHVDDTATLITRRLRQAFCIDDSDVIRVDLPNFQSLLCSLPTSVCTVVLKTVVNAWTTSHRLHETSLHPCLFGCRDGTDELKHYLKCGRLWRAVLWSRRCKYVSAPVLERLCLFNPSHTSAIDLVVAFRVYHDMKLARLQHVLGLIAARNTPRLASLVKQIAAGARRAVS